MNSEPDPLDLSALNNCPFPVRIWVRKAHPKERIVLCFSPRGLISITPSRIGNRANPSESTPPRAAKARSANRESPAQSWPVQNHVIFPRLRTPLASSYPAYSSFTGFYLSFFYWRICTHVTYIMNSPRPILTRPSLLRKKMFGWTPISWLIWSDACFSRVLVT